MSDHYWPVLSNMSDHIRTYTASIIILKIEVFLSHQSLKSCLYDCFFFLLPFYRTLNVRVERRKFQEIGKKFHVSNLVSEIQHAGEKNIARRVWAGRCKEETAMFKIILDLVVKTMFSKGVWTVKSLILALPLVTRRR